MELKLMENPEEMTALLRKALVKQSLFQENLIEELLKERDQSVELAKKEIQGTCYLLDYKENKLKIFDSYTGQVFHSITLPGQPPLFNPDDFDPCGTGFAIIDPVELQKEDKEHDITFNTSGNFGLCISGDKSYLYNPGLDHQSFLALTEQFIFGAIPKKARTNLPYDMYLSGDHTLLCLTNRDEGKIFIFNIKASAFTGELQIRNQGSSVKTINVAISMLNKKIFITDSITPLIFIYDLANGILDKKNPGLGVLGSLCLAPDEKSLYLFTIKPEQNLKNLDINTFSEIKSFPLKGELFSIGDVPADLLTLSPDKKYIFSMTFINDPDPFTPVITVIETEKNKAVKRFSVKDGTKPVSLCFRDINPVGPVNKTLEELLIQNGLSVNKLRDIKYAIQNGFADGVITNKENEKANKEVNKEINKDNNALLEVENESLSFEVRSAEKPSTEYAGIIPKKVKHVIIPPSANKHITDILLGGFWQKNEIDLSEIPAENEKLKEVAEKVRKSLEYYDIDIVDIKGFYENKLPLTGIIQREYILEMVDEEESQQRQTVKTAPTNCPNCGAPLLGAWECNACGFFLEKPEDALRRKSASADQLANLPKGNFFVVDAASAQLFEVDPYKVPVWKVDKNELDLESITEVVRLENMNTLILDTKAGKIIEITPRGRIAWEFEPPVETRPLNQPASFSLVSGNHLLIADTKNHRVMETDLDGNIIWQYGTYGTPGVEINFLNNPVYIQKTYDETFLITDSGNNRILELSRVLAPSGGYQMKTGWQYGNSQEISSGGGGVGENELNSPLMAFRNLAGITMILDAGNKRVIEVDQNNAVLWTYYTETSEESSSISIPTRVTKLKNRDILIVGDGKYVQIIPTAENRIFWLSNPADLSSRTNFRIVKENISKIKFKHGGSSRYMQRPGKPTETEKSITNPAQNIISGDKIKAASPEASGRHESLKPIAVLTPGETVTPLPVTLIDKIENKIMLTNRSGDIIWSYGNNETEKLFRINTAEITPEKTMLLTDAKGIAEIDMKTRKKIWEYDCQALSATRLKTGNTLIADAKNARVIEVNKAKEIVWEHFHEDRFGVPVFAKRIAEANTLITYGFGHIVEEVDPQHNLIWHFGHYKVSGNDNKHLCQPEFSYRLKNGNTLIADSKNSRIIEVSKAGEIVWSYNGAGDLKLISPNFVNRLKDEHVYIVHAGNRQIIEIDDKGKLIWKLSLNLKK